MPGAKLVRARARRRPDRVSAAASHNGTHFMQGREPLDLANSGRPCAAWPAPARTAAPCLVRSMQAVRAADTLSARYDAPLQTVSTRFIDHGDDLHYRKWRRLHLAIALATGFRSRARALPPRQAHRHRA